MRPGSDAPATQLEAPGYFSEYGFTLPFMSSRVTHKRQWQVQGVGLAVLAVVLWSGNYIIARGLNKVVSPVSLAFFRWLFATVLLLPLAVRTVVKQRHLFLPHWRNLCITALTGVSLFNTSIYIAGQYTTATNLALIGTTAVPLFVLLLSVFVLKNKPGTWQLTGAFICLLGILILLTRGSWANLWAFHFSAGDLWVLGGAIFFAIYTLLVRKKPPELSSRSYLFAIFLLGTLFLFPAWLWEQSRVPPFEWDLSILAIFLYLGLGTSVISFLAWNGAIHSLGPTRTSLFGNLIPVFSSIEAVLILHEPFIWVTVVSMGVILLGILVANKPAPTTGS
jgi:drug/metabolite transporter (DMT)-like permease